MAPKDAPMRGRLVRVPDALWRDALAVAAARGDNLSEIVRDALRRYVELWGDHNDRDR